MNLLDCPHDSSINHINASVYRDKAAVYRWRFLASLVLSFCLISHINGITRYHVGKYHGLPSGVTYQLCSRRRRQRQVPVIQT
jgi:hypothetical protein